MSFLAIMVEQTTTKNENFSITKISKEIKMNSAVIYEATESYITLEFQFNTQRTKFALALADMDIKHSLDGDHYINIPI